MSNANERPSHERLRVWHSALSLVRVVYDETKLWPAHERFGLTAQMRRAVVSIAANLAEGSARTGPRQMYHFSQIAHGSAREVQALLSVAVVLDYTNDERRVRVEEALFPVARQLLRLLQALARTIKKPPTNAPTRPPDHPTTRP